MWATFYKFDTNNDRISFQLRQELRQSVMIEQLFFLFHACSTRISEHETYSRMATSSKYDGDIWLE